MTLWRTGWWWSRRSRSRPLVGVASQAHTVTVTDPVGTVDARVAAGVYLRAPADPVGVFDARTVAGGYARTPVDLVGAVDSTVETSGVGHTATVVDPIGVADNTTKLVRRVLTVTNAVAAVAG